MLRLTWISCLALLVVCGSACGSTGFALSGAMVDTSHMCAAGSTNASYDLHATVAADNSTSQSVGVRTVSAVMVVAGIHGLWKQPVGSKYDAGQVQFSPNSVGAGSKATLNVTIPSSCSNAAHQGTKDYYGDYSVDLTIVTSAGTFHLTSQDKHRILAP